MKAIITKYIPATNTKPSRIKASAEGISPLTMRFSEAEDLAGNKGGTEAAHKSVAEALRGRVGWRGELIGGGLPDQSGYCFVFSPAPAAPAAPVVPLPSIGGKHTPGPWEIRIEEDGTMFSEDGARVEVTTESNTLIAAVEDETGEDWHAKEMIANARLIAAAPEMYDVLNEVELHSRKALPIKKATWLKVCDVLRGVDGKYR